MLFLVSFSMVSSDQFTCVLIYLTDNIYERLNLLFISMFKVCLDVYLMCYLAQYVKVWGNRDKKKIHCKDQSCCFF